MKKFIIVSLIILIIICITAFIVGCVHTPSVESKHTSKDSLFTLVEYNEDLRFYVVYMNDTKVMYAVSAGSENFGNFTLLVNKDGSPMVYKGQ